MNVAKEGRAPFVQDGPVAVVVGTVGHIDHGKTSLVRALTGTDTDRLPEEKRRGITIDLGFAAMALRGPRNEAITLSFVDVPGHHAFLQNMMAGAGGVDGVLLVIAADEGVRAQTRQHLAICTLLGVQRGLVALTKTDAVSAERLLEARAEVRMFVRGTPLEEAEICAVSSRTGEGLDGLKDALVRMALSQPPRAMDRVLRLPLDRAFSIMGFGTVATGTLHEGAIRKNEALILQPSGRAVRVRGLQVHRRTLDEAHAATRVAVNLAGVDVAEVRRGDVLVPAETVVPTSVVDVELTAVEGGPPWRHRSTLGLHAFAAESTARVLLYEEAGATRLARLRLARPMTLAPGDRFVLRQMSTSEIMGGGRVLDAQPDPRLRRTPTRRWLETMRKLPVRAQVWERVRRRGLGGMTAKALVRETALVLAAVERMAEALVAEGRLMGIATGQEKRFVETQAVGELQQRILKELQTRNGRVGARAELLSKMHLSDWVLDLAVGALEKQGRVHVVSGQVTLAGLETAGTAAQRQRMERVEEIYRAAGLAAPIVEEAAAKLGLPVRELAASVTLLLRAGRLERMGEDRLLIHTEALAALQTKVRGLRGQTMDVARFKEMTGLTRKHVIPLLEYLDRTRVTRNQGGVRTIL